MQKHLSLHSFDYFFSHIPSLRLVGIWQLNPVLHKRHISCIVKSSYLKLLKHLEMLKSTPVHSMLIPTPTPPVRGGKHPACSQGNAQSLSSEAFFFAS